MIGLLKLHEFAASRGEGLIPELLELLSRKGPVGGARGTSLVQSGSNLAPNVSEGSSSNVAHLDASRAAPSALRGRAESEVATDQAA